MPVPSTTPSRPGAITAAQTLVILQPVLLFCCGVAPLVAWWPAFLVGALATVPVFAGAEMLFWGIMLLVLVGGIAYAAVTVRRLGNGDRRGRWWVSAGLVVVAALTAAAVFPMGGDSMAWYTLATAAPSVAAQAIAWICVHSGPAERWFRECEPYLKAPAEPAGPED
ncbi:hypothetical protein LO763_12880 [Glycomyces sp. A-F 0318]|uniref:hypothetical protein n=1 Tax=Glycomyces amatae TaxID=2881355 RepID=UPI001E51CF26|nr:hypothetical protein [Glycomyces amatae]MCD0444515.1 hypothetical protein [Glycomyces amatae]